MSINHPLRSVIQTKNKISGVSSHFASSESEILRMQEVTVQEKTKKAMKSNQKVFIFVARLSSCFSTCPWYLQIPSI